METELNMNETYEFAQITNENQNLRAMNDRELMASTRTAVAKEKAAITNVTRHFQEVSDRRLYLPQYRTMFDLLTKEFGYCAGSAQLRINTLKLISDVPSVREKIEAGEMTMTVASKIQAFLQAEKKIDRAYSPNAKLELIETCLHKSVNDVEREFAKRNPEIDKAETRRFVSADRLRVSYTVSKRLEDKIARIKLLWSSLDPNMSREMLIERMADLMLEKFDPIIRAKRNAARRTNRQSQRRTSLQSQSDSSASTKTGEQASSLFHSSETKRTRYLKRETVRQVWEKNADRGCEFAHVDSGEICGSQFQLQIDHIQPFCESGSNESENLRILCSIHNRWRFEANT